MRPPLAQGSIAANVGSTHSGSRLFLAQAISSQAQASQCRRQNKYGWTRQIVQCESLLAMTGEEHWQRGRREEAIEVDDQPTLRDIMHELKLMSPIPP
eukprot:4842953-Amphidinium_carterae.9